MQSLANPEIACAGTVATIDGDTATFDVDRWHRGGDDARATLRGASPFGRLTSAGGPAIEQGTRLLVAGDGGFAWASGFTQPYDDVASQWEDVFGG